MSEPSADSPDKLEPKAEERERRQANLILLLGFAVVVGLGVWFVNVMFDQSKMDDCLSAGRRNCAPPIEVPAR